MNLGHVLYWISVCVPTIFILSLIVKSLRKVLRHRERKARGEPMIEDPQALAAAEREADGALDVREELMRDNTLLENFSAMQGYNTHYMEKLIAYLAENHVTASYYFLESMPAGAINVIGRTGTFELYVPRGSEEQARRIVTQFRQIP